MGNLKNHLGFHWELYQNALKDMRKYEICDCKASLYNFYDGVAYGLSYAIKILVKQYYSGDFESYEMCCDLLGVDNHG